MMVGHHNQDLEASMQRLRRGHTYRDLTTIIFAPIRRKEKIPAPVVNSWMSLLRPMNQACSGPHFLEGFEIGDAYNRAVETVLANNASARETKSREIQYMLTLESDNAPPPDGLLLLLESIQQFDVVGGLYWTKGEGGQPMIYGNPAVLPRNFLPQMPSSLVQKCNGLGMGFTLFRVALFERMAPDMPKNQNGTRQWFRTVQEWSPDKGGAAFTQDLFFFDQAFKYGAQFASDNRVKVGHYDADNEMMW